jgi:hypothetical protein
MNDEERAHLMPDTEIRLCPAVWRPIGQSGGNLKDIASPALDAHIVRDIPKAIAWLPARDDHKRVDPCTCCACATNGITVNAVAQSDVHTAMTVSVADEIVKKPLGMVPVCQLANPHEIGRRVRFLALGDAGFISRATIAINGGLQMGSPSAF